jgi:hypothetical protein
MSEDRLTTAIGRLERAMSRVEAAGATLQHAAREEASRRVTLAQELARLDERHRRLRASASAAITHIDGLMTPEEAGNG